MQIVIDEIDIGTPSEQNTDPEELSVEEQATVVAALDRDRCGLLRRENSMAEASSAMADETSVVRGAKLNDCGLRKRSNADGVTA